MLSIAPRFGKGLSPALSLLALDLARLLLCQLICLIFYLAHHIDYLLSIHLLETLAAAGVALQIGAGQAPCSLPDLLSCSSVVRFSRLVGLCNVCVVKGF